MTLGLSLSAPSGMLQQAFIQMKQRSTEGYRTIPPSGTDQEPGNVPSSEVELGSNSNSALAPQEALASNSSMSSPAVSLTSTATSSPPPSTGRVSPTPVSCQSQTPASVTSDPCPPPHSSQDTAPSQIASNPSIPPLSSSVSPPAMHTSTLAAPGPQLSNSLGSVSSVPSATSSNTGSVSASEHQPFNNALASSQPMNPPVLAPQHTTSQCQPVPMSGQPAPPTSLTSQSQPQPVESDGADPQAKAAGRDDIQALDKKLRSLFKDQSTTSSSVSLDPGQTTGTSSPPTGTSSPPPGAALVPPSNLPLTSGVQGVPGSTTTPGHAQTPPTKPRAQVSEESRIQE